MNLQSVDILTFNAITLTTGKAENLITKVPVGGGRNIFRVIFGLRVNTGGLADGIRFDAANARCEITFSAGDFDLNAPTRQFEVEEIGTKSLAVTLPAPMQVRAINFSSAGSQVELYRMDGDQLAKDATKTFSSSGNVAGDFTDRRFGVKLKHPITQYQDINAGSLTRVFVRGHPTTARIGLATISTHPDSIAPNFFFVIPGEVGRPKGPPSDASIGKALAIALQQHFDGLELPYPATVDLLLVVESDAPCVMKAGSFEIPFGLVRNSFRAVLLRAEDIANPAAFVTRLREASTPFTAYLHSKLNTLTQNALTRITGNTVPAPVLSNIVQQLNATMQAEAFYHASRFAGEDLQPATIAVAAGASGIARTRVNRTILEEAFPGEIAVIPPPDDGAKEVLRAQGANSALAVQVDVPRPIAIRAATLRIEGDLRADSPSNGIAGSETATTTTPGWDTPIPDFAGFSVDATRAVATLIAPTQASEASGVAAAISLTSPTAELIGELREDQAGIPNGRVLGSAAVSLNQLDRPAWVKFEFAAAVVVKAAPCWLVIRATNGSVLWLADLETQGTVRLGDPAPKGWVDRGQFTDRTPLHQLWTKTVSLTSTTSNGKGADIGERLRVSIGAAVLTPATSHDVQFRTVDIKDALQNLIAGVASGQLVSAPIRISALGTGNITVYPPEIEYDV
jgi:hypothetical protein